VEVCEVEGERGGREGAVAERTETAVVEAVLERARGLAERTDGVEEAEAALAAVRRREAELERARTELEGRMRARREEGRAAAADVGLREAELARQREELTRKLEARRRGDAWAELWTQQLGGGETYTPAAARCAEAGKTTGGEGARRSGARKRQLGRQRAKARSRGAELFTDEAASELAGTQLPQDVLERLTARSGDDEWHPAGGCMLRPEAWARRGTSGWLLDVVAGKYGLRWRPGESLESVPAYECDFCEAAHGNYASASADGGVKLGEELDEQGRRNIIEWYDPAEHGPDPQAFAKVVSPFAVVPKGSGIRPVHDLSVSGVNELQAEWPFGLPSVEDILVASFPGCRYGTRDWASGYFHLVIKEKHRTLLGLRHPVTGRLGRYRSYPMGLKLSAAIFCSVTAEFARMVHEELERRGTRRFDETLGVDGKGRWTTTVFAYVDDHPIVAVDDATLEETFAVMDEIAEELGVRFKTAKDEGRPCAAEGIAGQSDITALGARFSSTGSCSMSLAPSKAEKYLDAVRQLRAEFGGSTSLPLTVIDSLVGQLSWVARLCRWGRAFLGEAYDALRGTGHIRRRQRQRWQRSVSAAFWETDMEFWEDFLGMVAEGRWQGVSQWQVLPAAADAIRIAHHRVATDASTSWGAGGRWGWDDFALKWPEKARLVAGGEKLHISWLELQAILLAVRRWAEDWRGQTVLLETDNTAALAYLNKGGGSVPHGRAMMREVSELCIKFDIEIRGIHIPGRFNLAADRNSRGDGMPEDSDFMVMADVFDELNERRHTVDAACDREGRVQQPGTTMHFYPGERSFLAHYGDAAGERIWCCPPRRAAGLFMQAIEAAWVMDEATSATIIVPKLEYMAWY
jgi:hypothetical protein